MTTGQLIRRARKNADMTQADLARLLNIPFQSISQWERDLRNPKMDSLKRIANVLGIDWRELDSSSPFHTGDEFLDGHLVIDKVEYSESGDASISFTANNIKKSDYMKLIEFMKAEAIVVNPETISDGGDN